MRLEFKAIHRSIASFATVDLPDFTLITGPNGSGKSHLLEAIGSGAVQHDQGATPGSILPGDIMLIDGWSFLPQAFSAQPGRADLRRLKADLTAYFKVNQPRTWIHDRLKEIIAKYCDPSLQWNEPEEVMPALSPFEAQQFVTEIHLTSQFQEEIQAAITSWDIRIQNDFPPLGYQMLLEVARELGTRPVLLTAEQIAEADIPWWGEAQLFQHEATSLFKGYRDAYVQNSLAGWRLSLSGTVEPFLDAGAFATENGPPPWNLLNDALAGSGLSFQVTVPPMDSLDNFEVKLVKTGSGELLDVGHLSSGERILLALALTAYQSSEDRLKVRPPKILLLDEFDAPLHPQMVGGMLNIIQNSLVKAHGIKVILTTHSPSTVALAPDDAIHLMVPGKGLEKISKSRALNELTAGVPTLALTFDGRRQVFVESEVDAMVYSAFYDIVRPNLPYQERSLSFIAVGGKDRVTQTDVGGGCQNVKRVLNALRESGSRSCFGLVDRDLKNKSTDTLEVLGERTGRYSIENVLFDPLLVAAAICFEIRPMREFIGIPKQTSFREFSEWPSKRLQEVVNQVESKIFDSEVDEKIPMKYGDNLILEIDIRCITTGKHQWETKVLERFSALRKLGRAANDQPEAAIMKEIIQGVLAESPRFIPEEVAHAFTALLERPAH